VFDAPVLQNHIKLTRSTTETLVGGTFARENYSIALLTGSARRKKINETLLDITAGCLSRDVPCQLSATRAKAPNSVTPPLSRHTVVWRAAQRCQPDETARAVSISVSFAFVRGRPPATARLFRCRSRTVPTGNGHCTGVLKIGRSAVRPRPWLLYLTCTNGGFHDLFLGAPSQLSARACTVPKLDVWP
jgi:hypothetical protein